jgi:hypothetical protein
MVTGAPDTCQAPGLPGPIWRPTPHQGAAADEVENREFLSIGVFEKMVFAAQKK